MSVWIWLLSAVSVGMAESISAVRIEDVKHVLQPYCEISADILMSPTTAILPGTESFYYAKNLLLVLGNV